MSESRFPHPILILIGMVFFAQFLAIFLPAGTYDREEIQGKKRVVSGTYQLLSERAAQAEEGVEVAVPERPEGWRIVPAAVVGTLTAIPKGLGDGDTSAIIFFVFIVGGVVAILRETGAIDALLGAAIRVFSKQRLLLVGGMTLIFAVGSSLIGMAEEYMPFVPLLTAMAIALKMDAIVALGIVYIGAGVGYGAAALNPFTVVIARKIAGLEATPDQTGILLRVGVMTLMVAVGVWWILRYARRVDRDPSASLVRDVDYSEGFEAPKDVPLGGRRAVVLAGFLALIGIMAWGVASHGWYMTELGALFLGFGIFAAVVGGIRPNRAAGRFCVGAAEMASTALLIGVARGIYLSLEEAKVTDTIVYHLAQSLEGLPPVATGAGMLLMQSLCNLFIPSGSGQAYVTMPIMSPLATEAGVAQDVAVLAFQFGDGLTNMIVPTNALLMGMLALARIPYVRWLKFILPLFIPLYLIAIGALWLGGQVLE